MKKLLVSFLFLAGFGFASQAQTGSIFVQGTIGGSFTKYENDTKRNSFDIRPYVGYQFNENWTAGIFGGYENITYKPTSGNDQKYTNFSAGVFGRYQLPISDKFSFFGQADLGFGQEKDNDSYKANKFGINVYPGFQYALGKGWGLNFVLSGIHYDSTKEDGADKAESDFGIYLGQGYGFGISKNFGGK